MCRLHFGKRGCGGGSDHAKKTLLQSMGRKGTCLSWHVTIHARINQKGMLRGINKVPVVAKDLSVPRIQHCLTIHHCIVCLNLSSTAATAAWTLAPADCSWSTGTRILQFCRCIFVILRATQLWCISVSVQGMGQEYNILISFFLSSMISYCRYTCLALSLILATKGKTNQ